MNKIIRFGLLYIIITMMYYGALISTEIFGAIVTPITICASFTLAIILIDNYKKDMENNEEQNGKGGEK